jgi:hypothetical protein
MPHTQWLPDLRDGLFLSGFAAQSLLKVPSLDFTHFDASLFPQRPFYGLSMRLGAAKPMMAMAKQSNGVMALEESVVLEDSKSADESLQGSIGGLDVSGVRQEVAVGAQTEQLGELSDVPLRENLQETAFFYPQLQTDGEGRVMLKFTLPESLTTWRFLGVAHTTDLCCGMLEGETVAEKKLMVQPNMPRFVRQGDEATITSRIVNTSEQTLAGEARLALIDPETDVTVLTVKRPFTVAAGETGSVAFAIDAKSISDHSLLVAKVVAMAGDYSDGEQHYLPILPDNERVTVTVPFTQNGPGMKTIDLTTLVPQTSKDAKLTIEYTNNPAWLMLQALPAIGHPHDDCAICQAASLYANGLGKHIIAQIPRAKSMFEQWKHESGSETSLHSQLQKNQELKDLALSETPWVADADRETEQRQRLADFFDENLMQQRLTSAVDKLSELQQSDGSWSWWPGMKGSLYMTVAVAEMLVRQNTMTGRQPATAAMLSKAFGYLGREMVKTVEELKKEEQKGHKPSFPSFNALQWLYICSLDGRQLASDVQQANNYLVKLLKRDTPRQSIYEKALSAIILRSPLYIKSLKEYTVYKEEMGRYYDTPRAGYSWRDYRIPTQVAAIEAIELLTPDDRQTLDEMRRWLLQQKRTQAWDTPLNSVNAVYAFLNEELRIKNEAPDHWSLATEETQEFATAVPTTLSLDGEAVDVPKATAGIGYVKTVLPYHGEKTFTAGKTSRGTSWGAVYVQFMQPTSVIKDQASGVSIHRELFVAGGPGGAQPMPLTQQTVLKVGDRVTVRLTITAERDLDFVQLQDKRAACMEPVSQLSGYSWRGGYYCAPRDNVTNYYFDRLPKGQRVIETEYYIDRAGRYETGTCTVQCAYASEYRGTTHSQSIKVE